MRDRKVLRMWHWRPIVFFAMGMVSIVMLVATYRTSEGLRINYAVTDAIETTIIRVTTSHLWFEHWIAGDAAADIMNVWADLDDALRLVTVILNGGESEHGMILNPLKDPELRTRVEELGSLLTNFKTLALQRYQEPKGSPMILMLDQRSNAIFKEFRDKALSLQIFFEQKQIRGETRSRNLFSGILVIWAFIVVATTAVLWNRDRRRRETENALRQSEERFRITLEHSPISVFNQDRDLRYTWVYNPQLGFSSEEIVGKTDAELPPPTKQSE